MHAQQKHQPFFKLMSRGTGKVVLKNKTLRWTTPPMFNDPFDVQTALPLSHGETEGVRQAALDMLWESFYENGPLEPESLIGKLVLRFRDKFPKMERSEFDSAYGPGFDEILSRPFASEGAQAELGAFMARIKILCLTDRFDSVPMWSHYAEQHQGIALRFCTPEGFDSPWVMAKQVHYSDQPPAFVEQEFLSAFLAGRYLPDKSQLFDAMTYTKGSEWSYESEWRISSGDGRNPNATFEDLPFFAQEVDAIVLGCRMNEEDRAEFSALRNELFPHAELLMAVPRNDAYRMKLEPLAP